MLSEQHDSSGSGLATYSYVSYLYMQRHRYHNGTTIAAGQRGKAGLGLSAKDLILVSRSAAHMPPHCCSCSISVAV